MNEQRYQAISRPFQENPNAALWLIWANKALTVVGYVAYPVLLIAVALAGAWMDLVKFVVVPALAFALLSVFRARYNAPRPYEVLAIEPIIHKDTIGKSFPSRHTFSMMMIACSWLAWFAPVGIALIICACVMGALRVIGGVHFPRDVVAGALFAVVCASIGYCIIPW
ncbi:phosphatase PAP2 family protein [Anaerotardibacter muris]|uniref:phosphatase PAP2 family protein n=1 Tax=Anaerotardibacter muris TaxID=2941505 RepID=UPI00203ADF36|nr:phosphatase PAP2 family protein [Anaerotardibacter muris]